MGSKMVQALGIGIALSLLAGGIAAASPASQAAPQVLLVIGTAAPAGADLAMKTRLESLGYTVTHVDDNNIGLNNSTAATAAAAGKALVIISATCAATQLGTAFTGVAVPLINCERELLDELGMSGTGTNQGVQTNQNQIIIFTPAHAMAAGLTGTVTLNTTANQSYAWGVPGASATKVAHLTGSGNTNKATIFCYASGASMVSGTAPARRTGYFLHDATFTAMNANGLLLFDEAVRWTAGTPVKPVGLVPTAGAGQVSLAWTASAGATSYKVKRATVSGGPYTVVGTPATNTFPDNTVTNGTTYYYVVSAVNAAGESANSAQAAPTTPNIGTVLFVVSNSTTPLPVDTAVAARAAALGYAVAYQLDSTSAASQATGKVLVMISATVTPATDVAAKFRLVTVPVMVWENEIFDDMELTTPTGRGPQTTQTNITIVNSSHVLAAGLTGSVGVSSSATFNYGIPVGGGVLVAHTNGQPTRGAIFYYETGAGMDSGFSAPARRLGFFIGDTGTLTANGLNLVTAGIAWCVTPPPPAPTGLGRAASTGQVTLGWIPASGATSYVVKRSTTSGGPYTTVATVTGISHPDTGLTNGTTYYYVVAGKNAGGEGPNSVQVAATPIAAPTGLVAAPGNGQASLSWNAVTGATGYNVKRATVSGGPYTTVGSPTGTAHIDPGLTNGTLYHYVVSATNTGGESVNSSQVSVTPVPPPPPPTGIASTPGNAQVSLTWNAVSGATSYNVKRGTAVGGPFAPAGSSGTTSFNDTTGLTNGTTYYYVVSSVNAVGEGAASSPSVPATPFGPPTGLVATPGSGHVVLAWAASPGAQSYNVKRATVSGGPYSTIAPSITQTSFTNTGLANGTTYYFVVSALSGAVESANSTQVTATPIAPPAIPTGLSAVAGTSQVALSWTPVAGAASYTIRRSTTSGSGYVTVMTGVASSPATNVSLTNGLTYYFVICAVNAGGESTNSAQASGTPMEPPPGLNATPGNARIDLAWGTSAGATSYTVKRSTTSGGPYSNLATGLVGTTHPDTTAANGTTYYYVVSAVNTVGESSNCPQVSAAPLAPPATPTGLAATPVSTKVSLTWNSTATATSYAVKRSTTSGGPYSQVAIVGTPGFVNQGLTNGTTYYFVVSASNSSGESANSTQVSATPQLPPVPAVPYMLGPVSIDPSTIEWKWVEVANADRVDLHDDAHVLKGTASGGSINFRETGLAENTSHSRHVHSAGEGGSSGPSGTAAAWTLIHDPTVNDFNLAVNGTTITITVTPPPNGVGVGATACQIDRSTDLLNWSVPKGMNGVYSHPDSGLLGSTVYYYRIWYRNGGGTWTGGSPPRSATTGPAAPAAPVLTATARGTTSILWSWNNVQAETLYELHDDSHAVIASPGTDVVFFEETGLQENTSYSRHVHAINGVGPSAPSATIARYTLIHTPPASEITVTPVSANRIDVAFGPVPNPTSGLTWALIQRCTDLTSWMNHYFGVTTLIDTSVIPGTIHYYRIMYRNGDGVWSGFSPVMTGTTPSGGPAVPGLGLIGHGATWLTWTFGDVVGETGFELHDNAHNVKGSTYADLLTYTETGLTENTLVERHLHSKQGTNLGNASGTFSVWTQVHAPIAEDFSVTAISSTQVQINVIPPLVNPTVGSTGRLLDRSNDGINFGNIQWQSGQWNYTDTIPIVGGKVWYRFRYINAGGNVTGYSPAKSVTAPAGVTSAPGGPDGVGIAFDKIRWGWGNVAGETGYEVRDGALVKATQTADNLTAVESGLLENTAYTRIVYAMNGSGSSPASTPATRATLLRDPTAAFLTLTQVTPTHIRVEVPEPPNKTVNYTGCQIERSTNRVSWSAPHPIQPNYVLNDTTVVAGTQYFYRVSYRNQDGIGTAISPWVSLQAYVPTAVPTVPWFFAEAQSTSTIRFWWHDTADESSFEVHNAAHVNQTVPPLDNGILSYLSTGHAENAAVTRHVHAVNSLGQGGSTGDLTKYTLIHDPILTDFTVEVLGPTSVRVTVTPPANPGAASTSALIQRSPDKLNWSEWGVTQAQSFIFNDNSVLSNFTYYYRIRYVNGDGIPTLFSPLQPATTPVQAPLAPALGATAESSSSITWWWSNVWDETSYRVHDASHTPQGPVVLADILSLLETGLTENTPYTRHVHAYNGSGEGAASNTITRWTKTRVMIPSDMTLTAVSPTQVDISVLMPPNGNIAGSAIYFERSLDRFSWQQNAYWSVNYSRSDTGLIPGTTYYYRYFLSNGEGAQSPWSPVGSVTTPAGPPATPASFLGSADSPTAIVWSWQDVAAETSYLLHSGTETLVQTLGYDVISHYESGLTENTPYTRHVHASNIVNPSAASNSVTRYTRIHEPVANDIQVTLVGQNTAHIVITPPPNSTLGITGCQIDRSMDGINWQNIKEVDQNYVFDNVNLVGQVTYSYRVWFRNGDGFWTVNPSPSKVIVTPALPPTEPQSFQHTFDSSTSIKWRWWAANNPTGYVLHDNAHAVMATIVGTPVEYTETGLLPNTQYTRHLHATNAGGSSIASNSWTSNTMANTPTAGDVVLAALSPTSISITVTPPNNPTVGNTGCEIQRYNDGTWITLGTLTSVYSRNDTGLTPDMPYLYRVRFRDISGWNITPYSPIKMQATPPLPTTPNNFHVASQTPSTITWVWDSSLGAIGYQIKDTIGTVIATTGPSVFAYVEGGLAENTEHSRILYYEDAGGLSAPSPTVVGASGVHTAGAADFAVQPVSTGRVDIIVFSPPNHDQGQTGCEIQRSPDGSAWTTIKAFSATYSMADLGVSSGQTWHYRIQFRNRLGAVSGYSAAKTVTVGVPGTPATFTGIAQSDQSILWSWSEVSGASTYLVHDAAHALRGSSGGLSVVEGGLAENIQFTRHVHASNGIGDGPASTSASVYTRVHDPSSLDVTLRALTTTQIQITVLPPPNSTTGLTACEIQRSVDGFSWITIRAFAPSYGFIDTGLAPVTAYYYRIRFRNSEGVSSAYSPAKGAITVPPPVISTPAKKIKSQTIAVNGTVTAGVSAVRVYFGGADQGAAQLNGSSWTFSSGTNPEGSYVVTARAFIGAPSSDDSDATTITIDLTPPAPPSNVRTIAFNNTIDVEWDPSPSTDVAGYLVYRKVGAGGAWVCLNPSALSLATKYRDSSAANGTIYYYRVTAVDDALSE